MKSFFLSILMLFVGFFVGAYSVHHCPAIQRCSLFNCSNCCTHARTSVNNMCSCPNCHCCNGQPCSCQGKCGCNGGVSCPGKQSKECLNCPK